MTYFDTATSSAPGRRPAIWTWLPLTYFTTLSRHRTGDAVHLLTARQNGLDEVFSNDERLLAAASQIGIVGRNVIGRLPTTPPGARSS